MTYERRRWRAESGYGTAQEHDVIRTQNDRRIGLTPATFLAYLSLAGDVRYGRAWIGRASTTGTQSMEIESHVQSHRRFQMHVSKGRHCPFSEVWVLA